MSASVTVRMLNSSDVDVLQRVAAGVFDHPVDRTCAEAFLTDPHLHLAVAIDGDEVVGFVSAVDYIHPDKPRELWINEAGVASDCRNKGIGASLMQMMLAEAEAIGCREAWVLADADNAAAVALYEASGGTEERPGQRMFAFSVGSAGGRNQQ